MACVNTFNSLNGKVVQLKKLELPCFKVSVRSSLLNGILCSTTSCSRFKVVTTGAVSFVANTFSCPLRGERGGGHSLNSAGGADGLVKHTF